MGNGQLVHKLFVGFGHQPFILLFLVVAAGYALARVKIKGISLGATASSLIVGLALSLIAARAFGLKYQLAELTSTVFFNLFMPPRSGSSQTRFDSSSANCPSKKKLSRGVVAIQLGFPRPASRNLWVAASPAEKRRAHPISSSLSWNGLSAE